MPTPFLNIPDQHAHLKDGRLITMRHGQAGDELDIASLIAPAFAVYGWATRGNLERAIQNLAQDLEPHTFMVAVTETGQMLGATRISGRYRQPGKGWRLIRRRLQHWGLYGLICLSLKRLYNRLFEARHQIESDELFKSLSAVAVQYRSLGVASHLANFIDDYARAADYRIVSSVHLNTNAAVLAVQRKRDCVLTPLPSTLLAKLFRYPITYKSSHVL